MGMRSAFPCDESGGPPSLLVTTVLAIFIKKCLCVQFKCPDCECVAGDLTSIACQGGGPPLGARARPVREPGRCPLMARLLFQTLAFCQAEETWTGGGGGRAFGGQRTAAHTHRAPGPGLATYAYPWSPAPSTPPHPGQWGKVDQSALYSTLDGGGERFRKRLTVGGVSVRCSLGSPRVGMGNPGGLRQRGV